MNIFRRAWRFLSQGFWGPPRLPGETHGLVWGYPRTKSGQVVTEETALTISAFFAGVRILSETMAALPFNVHRWIDARNREIAYLHPVQRVIHDAPNPEMTASIFWQLFEVHKILWGNGYAEVGWDASGNCRALYLLDPWRVKPKRRESGNLYYEVDGGRSQDIEPDDMIHVPNFGTDGIEGKSTLTYARESLGAAMSARDYGANFFGSGGVPSGVLEHPGKPSPDAAKNIRTEWNQVHSPAHGGKSSAVAVLWEGMKYNKIGMPPEDAQFLETRAFDVVEVARWLNVPPHLLRDLSRATFSNIEHQSIEFVKYTLIPLLIQREQEINRKLLKVPTHYSKHNLYGLLRGDSESQGKFFDSLFKIGAFSPNDVLHLMDMNDVPGGDQRFVQLQLTTLDRVQDEIDARTRPPEPPAAPEGQPAPKPEAQDDDSLARVLAGQRACIVDAAARMVGVELTAVRRASAKPKQFQAELDEFYGRFEGMLAAAIAPPVSAFLAAGPLREQSADIVRELAADHCRESQAALLTASEVTADRLADSVAAVTEGWETVRPETLASSVERQAGDAKPMPVIKQRVRRVERDPQGRIARIVEEGG